MSGPDACTHAALNNDDGPAVYKYISATVCLLPRQTTQVPVAPCPNYTRRRLCAVRVSERKRKPNTPPKRYRRVGQQPLLCPRRKDGATFYPNKAHRLQQARGLHIIPSPLKLALAPKRTIDDPYPSPQAKACCVRFLVFDLKLLPRLPRLFLTCLIACTSPHDAS